MKAKEINFDGLVGPTHNYSGLSYGNVASMNSQKQLSNPKEAALQGLEKIKFLADLGIAQAVLPPPLRPHFGLLLSLGFEGSDNKMINQAAKECPELLNACFSAASMWTANAATISPSADTADHKVHITPANLSSKLHRSIEAEHTTRILRSIFSNEEFFKVHSPLSATETLADEGAANHNRFCRDYGEAGIELFVWGRAGLNHPITNKFPARQTYEASTAIARLHQIPQERLLFAQQNPEAIDAGIFHNDVIAVANKDLFLFHEKTFVDGSDILIELVKKLPSFKPLMISENQLSLEEAVKSYLFNSQLITLPDDSMCLIAPSECEKMFSTKKLLDEIIKDTSNPINAVHYLNLKESMANGGGPACLRLRIVLNEKEQQAMHQGVLFTPKLYTQLKQWIEKHYRDRLHPTDFVDPELLKETKNADEELQKLLGISWVQ